MECSDSSGSDNDGHGNENDQELIIITIKNRTTSSGEALKMVLFYMLVILVVLNSCGGCHPCIFYEVLHLAYWYCLIFWYFTRHLKEIWSRASGHIQRQVAGARDDLTLWPVVSIITMNGGIVVRKYSEKWTSFAVARLSYIKRDSDPSTDKR